MENRFEVLVMDGAFYVLDNFHQRALTSRRFSCYNLVNKVVQQMNDWENSESL